MNEDTIKRFWSKVEKTDGCWLWTASKRNKGYGAFVWADAEGRIIQGRAHRFMWELVYGAIPDGLCVLHRCDVPACVNPDHLFLGTKADNNRDMAEKGRRVSGGTYHGCQYERGELHHGAVLTEEKVLRMRRERMDGSTYSAIARRYGVGISCAWRAVSGETWSHVEENQGREISS